MDGNWTTCNINCSKQNSIYVANCYIMFLQRVSSPINNTNSQIRGCTRRQENYQEFKVSLGYIVSNSRTDGATGGDPVPK